MPDAYERTLPEIFPDFAPGSFTWDRDLDGWVWTTFNSFQWDVNWTNPDVFAEYAEIVLFLANAGVEVLRLDAIAFTYKRLGHRLPEPARGARDHPGAPRGHPNRLSRSRFQGGGDRRPRAVGAVPWPRTRTTARSPTSPTTTASWCRCGRCWPAVRSPWPQPLSAAYRPNRRPAAWVTYVRCHDDIGWAISDSDAAAVGVSGPAHRSFLSDWYSGAFPGSPARGLVFQYNPVSGDRRISGTAATLAGLEAAGEDETARGPAIARILLAHELVMGWGGIPVIWSGDELGMSDDPGWASEPGHEADNRWAHRPRIDWTLAAARTDPSSVPGRVFGEISRVARIRAGLPQLHASVEAEILPLHGTGVLPVIRRHPVGDHVGLYNVTADWRPYPAGGIVGETSREVLSGASLEPDPQGLLWIPPLTAWWIV